MKKTIRIICGVLIGLCGASILTFGISLFVQQQSWLMLGGLITIGGIGATLIWLGYSIARGHSVKDLLEILLQIAGAGPR